MITIIIPLGIRAPRRSQAEKEALTMAMRQVEESHARQDAMLSSRGEVTLLDNRSSHDGWKWLISNG